MHVIAARTGSFRASVRSCSGHPANYVGVGDLSTQTDWSDALVGVDCVIHCAARVHVMRDTAENPLEVFRRVNRDASIALAQQAAVAGVKRFVFVSSIKVNGEKTAAGQPFTHDSPANPVDPYGISKLEAEQALSDMCQQCGMELVIVRPPLVYGPGVKGNFAQLVRIATMGIPLPLGSLTNLRSMIAVDNLVDILLLCADRAATPSLTSEVFLVSDRVDVSPSKLMTKITAAYGYPDRQFPFPPKILQLAAAAIGKPDFASRICDELRVDSSHMSAKLGWSPVTTLELQLGKMARHV